MGAEKKILVISESIDVEDSSASKGRVALILNLKKSGYNVKVLHYTRKEIQLEGIECISIKELKFNITFILSRLQRVLQRILKVNFSRFLEKIFGHSFTFFNDSKSISKAINKHYSKENLIITLSKGASFRPHHAMLVLPKLHDKWMAYVHDPYPFHCYPRPYDWVESGAKYKEKFFSDVSEKAIHSAFPSLLLKEWMGGYFPNFLKTGVVIPHQNLEVKQDIVDLPSFFEEGKFNLFHAGNLMSTRPPLFLLKAYELFLTQNPEAKEKSKLYLIGKVGYYEQEIKEIQKRVPQIYCSYGHRPYDEVTTVQNNATASLIIESKVSISPFLPGKFPHCVSANKPIILLCPYYSETKRLLGKEYPYISEVDNIEEIQNIISKLYELWKKNKNLKLNRPDLEDYISYSYLESVFREQIFNEG